MSDVSKIRLRSLLLSRRGAWLLALLLGFITLIAAISLLALSGWFISAAALAGLATTAAYGFDYFRPAAIIRLCAIVRTAGRYAERLSSHYAALGLLKDLRVRSFSALAANRISPLHSADSLQRLVSDIDLLDQLPLKVIAPWLWACSLSLLVLLFWYLLSPQLLFSASLPVILALVIPTFSLRRGIALAQDDTKTAQQRRSDLLQPLAMLTSLLLWQRWQDKTAQLAQSDNTLQKLQTKQQQLSGLTSVIQQWLMALALIVLMLQGTDAINAGELTVPLLLAAALALLGLNEAMLPLSQSFIALGLSLAARDRLNQLTNGERDKNNTQPQPQAPYALTVNALSARQPGALYGPEDISFTAHSGDVILIKGPSGAGKSTLLQALANQLPANGSMLLNGSPLSHWQLQHTIGYLPQQLDIFDLSLAQNLRLGAPEASEQELWQMLDAVALADWARSQPAKLDTVLGEYGAAVSGGQARRIALARLLLAKRPLLLLDEPFSGLEQHTMQHVMRSLIRQQKSGILIIVSHQLPADVQYSSLTIGDA